MPDPRKGIYWDSCVFLSYVNEVPDRMPVLDALLHESSNGTIKIYTSGITKVEVAFAASERESRSLSSEVEIRIDSLWNDPGAVATVEFHDGIGRLARTLMRNALTVGRSLKPFDAIHLATAQWLSQQSVNLVAVQTYETRWRGLGSLVGLTIEEPTVSQPFLLPPDQGS